MKVWMLIVISENGIYLPPKVFRTLKEAKENFLKEVNSRENMEIYDTNHHAFDHSDDKHIDIYIEELTIPDI